MNIKTLLLNYTGERVREVVKYTDEVFLSGVNEVRLRADKPLIIKKSSEEWFISNNGYPQRNTKDAFSPSLRDISSTVELISNYSLYAFEEELKNGFITIPGGSRVGLCGQTVIENGRIKAIKNISGLNIRITHEIKGCSDNVIKYITNPVRHTLIISPPGRGKTTLLRDIIRQLSNGINGIGGVTVGVVDERSELASCYLGIAQNDLGIRTDVLDACPKAEGMLVLLRSMSPQVIAVDEIGKKEDIEAINDILNAGIKLICTVHGASIEDATKKPILSEIIKQGIFERLIVLKSKGIPGGIEGVYDGNMKKLQVTL